MTYSFNGLNLHLGNISRLSNAVTRSICAENFSGQKGKGGMATEGAGADAARELGQGWKVSPCIHIAGREAVTLADIEGRAPSSISGLRCIPKPGDTSSCGCIGTMSQPPRLKHRWVTFLPMAGANEVTSTHCRSRSTRPAASTATGKCPFAGTPASPLKI